MFDVMITYRMDDLKSAVNAIHKAESKNLSSEGKKLVKEARALVAALPITENQANDPDFAAIFKKKRKKAKDIEKYAGTRQAEVEAEWDAFVVDNYKKATQLANKAK